ncbi:hypothetical protein [Romboutsia lituseburensis]|uniref:DUF2383 domain-containing protein n=2 Tax=root TaxID=1 RepID=A0A1G9UPJ4_9FIRM|nr:hypothetical protein [Romboutsia lituseburensis]CEH36186.1 Hypothetical protein RLITU_3628 [Romboutsia lituseburensis]SDM61764.1 hypothetical protein SAMN04515677_1216 [Romboutsia lituseburensis DSM 797]
MNQNAELLNFIYQNSQMGIEALQKLVSITKDSEFNKCLQSQLNEYKLINSNAVKKLNENGYDEKGIGTLTKIQSYIMLNIQTMMDKSPSHIAEMLITGSTMGTIDAIKNIKKYKDAEPSILELMNDLKKFEENNIEQLKAFL